VSSPPPRDPSFEKRFLSWLAERDPESAALAPSDLEVLAELGGLEREGASFAQVLTEAGLPDEHAERLLRLHAAWTQVRRLERERAGGVSWVGQASPPPGLSESVTWVESSPTAAAQPPRGPAPSLLAPGAKANRPETPSRGLWRVTDVVVPACLAAALLLLLVPVALERVAIRELRAEAVTLLTDELSRGERPARLAAQAAHGAWLAALRGGQRRLVNENCEGGEWCLARLAELDDSERLARALIEDARAHGTEPPAGWQVPQAAFTREMSRIQASLAAQGGGLSEDPEQQQRAKVLLIELAWLREESTR